MSNQRYIDVSFWDDSWIQDLDPSEKLVYMYLLTNPLTNIAGVYQITRKRICFDTGFTTETIGHILKKFETAGKVYTFKDYIILKNWCKHQKVESSSSDKISNVKIGIDRILNELPDDLLIFLCKIDFSYIYLKDLLISKGLEGAYKDLQLLNLDLDLDLTNTSISQNEEIESQQKVIETLTKNLEKAMLTISKLEDEALASSSKKRAKTKKESESVDVDTELSLLDFETDAKAERCLNDYKAIYSQKNVAFNRTEKTFKQYKLDFAKFQKDTGRSWEEIYSVLNFLKTKDNFWFPIVVTPQKLFEKYEQILMRLKQGTTFVSQKKESAISQMTAPNYNDNLEEVFSRKKRDLKWN